LVSFGTRPAAATPRSVLFHAGDGSRRFTPPLHDTRQVNRVLSLETERAAAGNAEGDGD